MAVKDTVRAEVFRRDRAICSISGTPLWIIDIGATPFWTSDWVDHVKPASRGGADTVDNLVCASAEANYYRSNNTRDQRYLFSRGVPAYGFFLQSTGVIDKELASKIRRYQNLYASDWYFNRAVTNIMVWCEGRYDGYSRKQMYWCTSALKRLKKWRTLAFQENARSFEARRLVLFPKSPDVSLMLSLRNAESVNEVRLIANKLSRLYNANCKAWDRFLFARSNNERLEIMRHASESGVLNPILIKRMQLNVGALANLVVT